MVVHLVQILDIVNHLLRGLHRLRNELGGLLLLLNWGSSQKFAKTFAVALLIVVELSVSILEQVKSLVRFVLVRLHFLHGLGIEAQQVVHLVAWGRHILLKIVAGGGRLLQHVF